MAQPIQYTPQFIQTDVGAIQDKLNARQGQYDTAYASTLGAEDQFGQYDVHAKDIDLKNKVIGGFKDRVKSLVDQYGGDYAAASKQLVKEIVNTKNDKFFKLAAERNKLAEEQRRLVQQYGPNAIVLKDVTKPDLMDSQGNYIRPEDLSSEVLNREHFEKILDTDFGLLKNKKRESALTHSGTPGYLRSTTTQGITSAEVNQVAQDMYATLKKTRPDLPDDIAINIANNQAKSYVLGSTNQLVSDKQWDLNQQRAEYDRTHPATPPGPTTSLITPETYGKGRIGEAGVAEYNTIVGNFKSAANDIPVLKDKIAFAKAHLHDKPDAGSDMTNKIAAAKFPNSSNEVYNRRLRDITDMEGQLKKARENYVNSEKIIAQKYPIYNNIKNDKSEYGGMKNAWKAVSDKINEVNAVYPSGLAFRENTNTNKAIVKEFNNIPGSMMSIDPKTGKEINSKKTFLEIVKGDDKKITKSGILPGDGKMFFEVDGVKYTLPVSSVKNSVLKNMQTDYNNVRDIYSGSKGTGLFKLVKGSDGKYTANYSPVETPIYSDEDGKYIRVEYKNGKISSKIVNVENGAGVTTDLAGYTDAYGNQIAKELASDVKLEPITVRP